MTDAGTYALVIHSENQLTMSIGRLGTYDFKSGYYVYAGSALSGLNNRLKRHLRREKSLHWHIDYLLQQANIIQVWYSLSKEKLECVWNEILAQFPGAMPYISGFGSSDCRCKTHLTYFSAIPSFDNFKQELRNRGLPELYQLTI
jgi:sugar fermentation stimulation protein A